jgi:hypothetical protein
LCFDNARAKQKRRLRANNSFVGLAMTEKKPSVEEVMQKIDQLLVVLKEISQDLTEISRTLKAAGAPSPATAPTRAAAPTEPRGPIKGVRALFPKELEDMLLFEEKEEYVIIKPRRFLGSENFAKIASIIRGAGGEYISAGKESHFKVPKEAR